MDLTGRPIAITGASSGIGRATALACARAGMPVLVSARRLDRLQHLVEEIRRAGGRAEALGADVGLESDCRAVIDRTADAFGSIYAVFANAGYALEKPVLDTPEAELRDIFETNFWGTLHTIRPALERMLPAGRGHVLICSSCLSKMGMPYHAAYSATKAAQDHFARGLRIELRGRGISISSVHPIGTRTELFDKSEQRSGGRHAPRSPEFLMQPPDSVARAVVRCLRRPRGEVWTSLPARFAFAAGVAFPGLTDRVLRRMADRATWSARKQPL
jgi:short-subunit dehydrogenase